ncbi:hypothetical protein ACFW2V_13695 [Streptomyces sp. NPDC058947]|uniref:hypothetical protein n=1 Tax=Streptomyces sp. NPDC058947 TaxID=3346675 RepID=UPI00368710AC
MARDIKVHTGYYDLGEGRKEPTAWVETGSLLKPGPLDLVDGLASKYLRYEGIDDDGRPGDRPKDLPERMTQRQILAIYRDELLHYGRPGLSAWGENMGTARFAACMKWVREIVDEAFPGLKGYTR